MELPRGGWWRPETTVGPCPGIPRQRALLFLAEADERSGEPPKHRLMRFRVSGARRSRRVAAV